MAEIRLSKIARQFNIGLGTLIDFLNGKGANITSSDPNAKISDEFMPAVEVYKYRWTTPGVPSKFPKVSQLSSKSAMNSTRFIYNRTNFDLTNVALTYNIPDKVLTRLRLKSASASMVIDNLYIFTPDQKRGLNSYKTMMYGYPRTRTLTLGVNIGF